MIHSPLRAALENGDARTIQSTIQNVNRSPKDVINILCDIFDTAVLSHWELESSSHPIITVNSVKNIISDNKVNPSIPLLLFASECVQNLSYRIHDVEILSSIQKDGLEKSIFISDLQNDLEVGSDRIVSSVAKVFLASDRSSSVLEVIAEVLYRDFNTFSLFTFHLMRAFAFQERKDILWSYILSLINQTKNITFSEPAPKNDQSIDRWKKTIINHHDESLLKNYSIMERLWNSEYVRINQYKNEILKSLDSLSMIEMKVEKSNPDHWVCKGQNEWGKQFIMSAEKIINKNISLEDKKEKIVYLESLRSLAKNCDDSILPNIGEHIEKVLS
ncbi:MAG: hypothetical protein HOK52_03370 [Candidatus Marinimicrobia bacterium]|jgi:hypothetical protein|nr:hypothetical protein [Candidatus Neomarinimicrobiota bacterium]MBT3938037.1 hypothetical protein [Candidatus Neomarinimicrobiota bacterium]MBT3961551.1 hypothetical protein [Candidatus Neomarinimicrobiota bacterium]MBT4382061.1 hypothetical protein [Candidatus Neomarinimicrobiota bacterium]MBT4636084.1 hypothetical protein [Candidatus Neomarinimicrobiota bacterium]